MPLRHNMPQHQTKGWCPYAPVLHVLHSEAVVICCDPASSARCDSQTNAACEAEGCPHGVASVQLSKCSHQKKGAKLLPSDYLLIGVEDVGYTIYIDILNSLPSSAFRAEMEVRWLCRTSRQCSLERRCTPAICTHSAIR